MQFNIPKYVLKRMFPPGKSMFLVKKDGATSPNYVMFKSINTIMPIEVMSYQELAGFNVKEVPNYAKVTLDGNPLEITESLVKDDISFWFEGKSYNLESFESILSGKGEPFLVPIGAQSALLLRIRDNIKYLCTAGAHSFNVMITFQGFDINLDVALDLLPENMNIEFDPNSV